MTDPESNVLHESSSDSGTELAQTRGQLEDQQPGSSIFDSGVIHRRAPGNVLNTPDTSNILEEASGLSQVPLHKQLQAAEPETPEDNPDELPQAVEFRAIEETPEEEHASATDSGEFTGFQPASSTKIAGEKPAYRPRQRQTGGMPIGSLILAAVLGPITVWIGWMIYHAVIDDAEPAPTAQETEEFELDATPFQPIKDEEAGGFRPGAQTEPGQPKFRTFERGNFRRAAPGVELPEPAVEEDADVVAASQEKQARQRYRQTLKLLKSDPDSARAGLEEIIRRYPATDTAAQARLQLATLQRE